MTIAVVLFTGIDYSWISEVKLPVDKRCTYRVTFTAGHVDGSSGQIRVDSLVLVPALSESQSLQLASKCLRNKQHSISVTR